MKTNLFRLRQLIESTVSEMLKELAPEAPKNAPFGQYLFAPDRDDLTDEERQETNTKAELRFRDALRNNYEGDPRMLGAFAQEILAMVDKGWYNKILAAPGETVYRYISDMPTELAAKMLGESFKKLDTSGAGVQVFGVGTMHPGGQFERGSGIHSWSTQLEAGWIAEDLQPPPLQPGQTAMILEARTSEANFFINPRGIELVAQMPRFAYEQNEVISYGPIRFDKAFVITNPSKGMQRYDALESMDVVNDLLDAL